MIQQSHFWMYESESHSVVSSALQPHGLYSQWNSPGQNTGVCSYSPLQGIFPTQGSSWMLKWLSGKQSACQCRGQVFNPGLGRSPGVGNGNQLQYSCLENFIDRGARQAEVYGVIESDTTLPRHWAQMDKVHEVPTSTLMVNEWVSFACFVLISYVTKCLVWTTPKYKSLEYEI